MKIILHILFYDLFICKLVNAFIFPIAWLFRNPARKDKGLLWYFLHDGNDYGDSTYRANLKAGFVKAWLWALRNPLHNYYYRNVSAGMETNIKGTGTVKHGTDISSWRTFVCSDTGDNNGKILDFEKSKFGTQDITFDRNGQKNYRKSYCKPFRCWLWAIIVKWRIGHEHGLLQSQFNFPIFWMNGNRVDYMNWRKLKWVKILLSREST